MQSLRPYHFARPRARGAREYCRQIRACGGALCFDLEDSVYSPDQAECRVMKEGRRREVMGLLEALGEGPGFPDLFVRINAPGTDDYKLDLHALGTRRYLPGLFLPKVESANEIENVLRAFPEPPPAVVPVVESRAGFASVSTILAMPHASFHDIAFGHCDYNLDCGYFPFYHQDTEEYWSWIDQIDAAARASGKGVVNSPVLRLDDEAFFNVVVNRLTTYPSVRGQVTLSLMQARQCAAPHAFTAAKGQSRAIRRMNATSADDLVRVFEQHRVEGSFFAIDDERTVISPHEYRAALRRRNP